MLLVLTNLNYILVDVYGFIGREVRPVFRGLADGLTPPFQTNPQLIDCWEVIDFSEATQSCLNSGH